MSSRKRVRPTTKRCISSIVKAEYKKRGLKPGKAEISFLENEIAIFINSEKPYLGDDFVSFVENVQKNLQENLETSGYKYLKTIPIYDYSVIVFVNANKD